jgi:hypothetical protein
MLILSIPKLLLHLDNFDQVANLTWYSYFRDLLIDHFLCWINELILSNLVRHFRFIQLMIIFLFDFWLFFNCFLLWYFRVCGLAQRVRFLINFECLVTILLFYIFISHLLVVRLHPLLWLTATFFQCLVFKGSPDSFLLFFIIQSAIIR